MNFPHDGSNMPHPLPPLNGLRAFEAALHGEALPDIDAKFLKDGKLA